MVSLTLTLTPTLALAPTLTLTRRAEHVALDVSEGHRLELIFQVVQVTAYPLGLGLGLGLGPGPGLGPGLGLGLGLGLGGVAHLGGVASDEASRVAEDAALDARDAAEVRVAHLG